MTKPAGLKALIAAAIERHGRLDDMVNNASWTHRKQPALALREDDFDKCYAINVKSTYLSTFNATPVFRARDDGSFVNIASTAGVRPRPSLLVEFAGGPVDEKGKAKFRSSIPLGRFSTVLDVANAVLYLVSDKSDFISDVCIEVDGARCV